MGTVSGVFSAVSYETVKSGLYTVGAQVVNDPLGGRVCCLERF